MDILLSTSSYKIPGGGGNKPGTRIGLRLPWSFKSKNICDIPSDLEFFMYHFIKRRNVGNREESQVRSEKHGLMISTIN